MSNRTAKFASAIFVGLLAGVAQTPISSSAAHAADDCLSGPKGQTPAGGHWYYRIDRATKRHCWYLREENEGLSRITPQSSASLPKPVLSRQEAVTRSIANARAELPLPQTRIEAPSRLEALRPAKPADTPVESGQRENVWDANTQTSVVASRWPEFAGTKFSANTAFSNMDAPAKSVESTSPTPPPSMQTTGQVTAADLPSQTPTYSVQQQLAALLGALALAGMAGSVTFKFGSPRSVPPRKVGARRGTIREPTDDDAMLLSAHPQAVPYARRTSFASDLDRARRNDRIAEFFSHLSRHAPT
jgi:hypothetical protein